LPGIEWHSEIGSRNEKREKSRDFRGVCMNVTKGLVIADPWIGYILEGQKTWEMRAQATAFRGWFGLIRKGTGAVWGVARLADCGNPLSPEAMVANHDRHRIPDAMIRSGEVARWNTPWILADIRRLPEPVPYRHRHGAVTWVELDPEVSEAIRLALLPADAPSSEREKAPLPSTPATLTRTAPAVPAPASGTLVGQTVLTEGNLKNSHIYLRGFFDRFPSDAIGGSSRGEAAPRTISVDWDCASPVETDLDGEKMFFRSRSIAKRFFADTGAEPGDRVLVTETAPYCYSLALQKGD
jgi:hypothetical protein